MTISKSVTDNNSVIAVNYPAALLRLSVREGITSRAILEKTIFSLETLESAKNFVPFDLYKQMILNAYQHLNKPHLGLQLGMELGVTTHGMLGVAALSSLTYGGSLNLTARYFKCRFPVFECLYKESNESISLELHENVATGRVKLFLIESIFSSLKEVSKLLIGDACEQIHFEFDFPEPEYLDEYQKTLGDNIHFNRPGNRMLVPKSIEGISLKMAEPLTKKLAESSCRKVLVYFPQQAEYSNKIRSFFKIHEQNILEFSFLSMERISEKLNMSPRTLRRRLKQEGTSFQELIDERREKLAIRYLKETELSITQIASRLDFNDAGYFSRSFKRRIGVSPKKYREGL